ncbi:MAG: nitroreductase family protein [Candidatus Riflebacteria bacterium]|nr:nitroreductase family protein [Candidatus Riflebacteria bacterium]
MNDLKLASFKDLIKNRRSVRSFTKESVDVHLIEEVMEAVKFSPTPTNRQCFKFIGVSDPLMIEEIRQEVLLSTEKIASNLDEERSKSFREYAQWFSFFNKAPIVLFAFFRFFSSRLPTSEKKGASIEGVAELQAFGGAIHGLLLGLEAVGLSACWMSGPLVAEEKILSKLKIERPWRLGAVIPVGYTDSKPAVPKKPEFSAIFQWSE